MANVYKINADGLRIPVVTADPSSPENGMIWYNSTSNTFKKYENGATSSIAAPTAADVSYDNGTSGLTATDVQDAIDEVEGRLDTAEGSITGNSDDITDLVTLSGVAVNSESLGTFTGDTIPDSQTIKQALQALETEVETKADSSVVTEIDANVDDLITLSGVAENATSLGTFTGATIPDSSTIKAALQSLETAVEGAEALVNGLEWQDSALDYVIDNTVAPATEVSGDRYILSHDGGAPHADYDGASAGDIVEFDGATWVATTPTTGMFISADDEDELLYYWGGAAWTTKSFEATTASTGLTKSGLDIQLASSSAGAGLAFDTGVLSVNVDDSTLEVVTDTLQVKDAGIANAKIATGIDAAKLADGSVSNTEFQYLDGVTSSIQDQLDAKLESLSEDATPSLGGDLTLGDNTIIHDSNGMQIGTSATDFYEHEYIHATTLTASQSSAVASALTFAHASFEAMLVEYKIKEATTNRVRTGQLYISTNGTDTSIVDTFGETGDVGVTWDLNVNGANIEVRYTTTANAKTMRAIVKRIKT